MASNNIDLASEIRDFAQYEEQALSDKELIGAINRAEKHLTIEARIEEGDFYDTEYREKALYWTSLLFSKLVTGELDAKSISVGSISENKLLANGDEITFWYSEYRRAKKTLLTREGRSTRVGRSSRTGDVAGSRSYADERGGR
jgi:hypothetical protein